jgi:cytoskeletal protein RodZ
VALFNRKKQNSAVLPEIEKYYDAEKRDRAGLAWLLAIVSIVCVVAVLIGLFFGGRWIYRKAAHSDTKTGVSTSNPVSTTGDIGKADNKATSGSSANPSTNIPTTPTPAPAPPVAVPQTPPSSTPKSTTPAPTPIVTPRSGKLANTGPSNTVMIFIVASIAFAGVHSFISRTRRGSSR